VLSLRPDTHAIHVYLTEFFLREIGAAVVASQRKRQSNSENKYEGNYMSWHFLYLLEPVTNGENSFIGTGLVRAREIVKLLILVDVRQAFQIEIGIVDVTNGHPHVPLVNMKDTAQVKA
jgi:hypothetical protein